MSHFAELSHLVRKDISLGASSAVEKLFGSQGFAVWTKAVKACAVQECGEELVDIPEAEFPRFSPHAYLSQDAPYGKVSPFFIRCGVLERLRGAQRSLRQRKPDWNLKIFDGFRPMRVQRYLVDLEFEKRKKARKIEGDEISVELREEIFREIYQIFAKPDDDPRAITPHSTGGAVDVTLVDASGEEVAMGSEIDAYPPLCLPSHFQSSSSREEMLFHEHRRLLEEIMTQNGFRRLPQEWWHFSYGDPGWAVLHSLAINQTVPAVYGRIEGDENV